MLVEIVSNKNMEYIEAIEKNFEKFIKDLEEIVVIPSFLKNRDLFPEEENLQKVLDKILNICSKLGFKVYKDRDKYYGYAEYGKGEKILGVLGHLDILPPGELDEWKYNPFNLKIKKEKCYGRGVKENKGLILTAIYALKNLIDMNFNPNYRIRFIFGIDGERELRGIEKYKKKEEIPDFGIVTNLKFPIFEEKGILQCKLIGKNETDMRFIGGENNNLVPDVMKIDKNKEILEELKKMDYSYKKEKEIIKIKGKSAHSEFSEFGINAIIRYVNVLENLGKHSKSGKFIMENLVGYRHAEPIFEEICEKYNENISFNLWKIEFTEKEEKLYLDMRFPHCFSKDEIVDLLKKKLINIEWNIKRLII